ncbi:MAG: glucose-1-phosphate cytidylyltransferase [Rhodovulum sulfidophilum]|uniref:Glucose-1-phosphate cytidylyltransferase n=1 Tax=Rhodovulum sulfidophilum TaxID=35806 RepID=A0A2W5QDH4_RHOSU|nr:MAG: glucose-1-phosphate cytidylyltransferase [Rhodovulum sulfidophilum]
MKVVLFCGGMGTRLRDYSETIPKPLVPISGMPILWHIMRYYAHYGHKDFILCLGYKAEAFKRFFLDYNEAFASDFVLDQAGSRISILDPRRPDWRITFVDTGADTNIGGRLLRVRKYLEGESMFLANYADVLTDMDLDRMIREFRASGAVASFLSVPPPYSFHLVSLGEDGRVGGMMDMRRSGMWMNGGYMALRPEIFDYLNPGEELVVEGFERLIAADRLIAHRHEGFWMPMDTFKEKQALDDLVARGDTPWQVWKHEGAAHVHPWVA